MDDTPEAFTTSYTGYNAPQTEREMTEAEYVLAQEEYELQALVAAMEEEQGHEDPASQQYGSDDEDYDRIFEECTTGVFEQQSSGGADFGIHDPDAMDMTDG